MFNETRDLLLLADGLKVKDWTELIPILRGVESLPPNSIPVNNMSCGITPRSQWRLVQRNMELQYGIKMWIDEDNIFHSKDVCPLADYVERWQAYVDEKFGG